MYNLEKKSNIVSAVCVPLFFTMFAVGVLLYLEVSAHAAAPGDLSIPMSKVSASAGFYPVEIDGVKLEVIAVKAPDGSIRTAFNTCQICFDSGRGYYKQSGNALVCQNCGSRFAISQIEVVRGGCNPVPILPENKKIEGGNIVVPREFLVQAKEIFANWKTDY
ncbi:MAG: DUF2318 domain-containing protein [Acidaminococcales bacterium]|jgi:uncharacterized membrane protein|nr:DUF2318 domain-containing protein [Acidaminococcales bacterium]